MGIDDTNSHVQSLEQGATDARQRSGFAPQKRRLSLPAESVWEQFRPACRVS
jgi:hypothetical protein